MAISIENVVKEFGTPPVRVLHDISFNIAAGEFVAISGKSGSGKSTLLYIISTLDDPTHGSIVIDGMNVAKMTTRQVHAFRNQHVGFVFQFHYLLPELTALENILLPARNLGQESRWQDNAYELLDGFGLADKAQRYPGQMSGGEQQRIAIARALILKPRYIFADEPTGNLDTENSENVMKILMNVNQQQGTTIVLVTHDPDFAAMAKREIYLVDGKMRQDS